MSNNPVTQLVSICGIAVGSFYSMNVYEPLCWMGCAYLLVRATSVFDTACPRQSVPPRLLPLGPREYTGELLLVIDSTRGDEREQFETVEDLGVVDSGRWAMPWEQRQHIYLCRNLKMPLRDFWPQVKEWL